MTKEEFRKLSYEERPRKTNLTLEQFAAEQIKKEKPFDYISAQMLLADCYDEKTQKRYSKAWRVPYHLNTEYMSEAIKMGLIEQL